MHAFSTDGLTWRMGHPAAAYTTDVLWADGSNVSLARRERPVLVFRKAAVDGTGTAGCAWVPVALINGALNRTNHTTGSSIGEPDLKSDPDRAGDESFSNTPTFTLIQPVLHE